MFPSWVSLFLLRCSGRHGSTKYQEPLTIVEIFVSSDHHRICLWRCISSDTSSRWRVLEAFLARRSNATFPSHP
jgi:hypothetical protein